MAAKIIPQFSALFDEVDSFPTKSNNVERSRKKKTNRIRWPEVSKVIHNGLSEMYLEDMCTDFEIEADRKTFRCHKVVLASVSDYFKAMFSSGMKEAEQNKATFEDISAGAFETLFNILYRKDEGTNPLDNKSEEDMTELFNMAARMQMKFLTKVCEEYFRNTMSVRNCVERWKIGQNMLCDDVADMAWEYMLWSFDEVVEQDKPALLSLGYADFIALIGNDELSVGKEELIWELIRDWIRVDDERKEHFLSLLQECCLTSMDPQFLIEELPYDALVRANDQAAEMVQGAVKYNRHPDTHGNLELKFRACYEKDQSLVLLAHDNNSDEDERSVATMAYNKRESKWENWPDLPGADDDLACCVHEGSLYVSGGSEHNSLYEFNGDKMTWSTLRRMPFELDGHTMTSAVGCLFVLGGTTKYGPSNRVHNTKVCQYMMNPGNWVDQHGEILASVYNASSVCINNKIYLFGGEIEGMPSDAIQMYDVRNRTSTILSNLPDPVRWSRALCRGNTAYIITSKGDVIKFSTVTGEIQVVATIPSFSRTNFGVDLRNNRLSVYGGRSGFPTMPTLETDLDETVCSAASPTLTYDLCDSTFVVDIVTGKVEDEEKLPRPLEVFGCASLVHKTEN